ncbi:MAG: alpha-galactosidase [Candidatus Thorarchaeota archaeon]|nr:alpha-galactosidase [Candidatus Thorarchaeota archaeon]
MPNDGDPIHLDVGDEGIKLTNGLVTVFFDIQLGLLMLTTADEKTMCFSRAYAQVHTEEHVYDSREMVYKGMSTLDFTDERGEGKAVVIRMQSPDMRTEMHVRLSVVRGLPGYSIVVQFKNRSGNSIRVNSIDPFVIDIDDATRLHTGWSGDKLRFFRNGFHSWELTQTRSIAAGENLSHLFTVIHHVDTYSSLVLGFVTMKDQFSTVIVYGRETEEDRLARIVASSDTDDIIVGDKQTVMSEELLVIASGTPESGLDTYAEVAAQRMHAVSWPTVPTGWCSWYFYYTQPDEKEVCANTDFLSKRFPNVEWVQIDDGYQRTVGDWSPNDRFHSGLKNLSDHIRDAGFKPGIWTAPFIASEHSSILKDHPDWFVRDNDNQPLVVGTNPLWFGNYFALDLTNPLVIDMMERLFKTLREDGFEYFKIDFLFCASGEGLRHNMNMTRAQAIRQGLEAIRRAVGDHLILGCGAPLGPCVGITNMMRIGTDIAPAWRYEWGGGVYECAINTMTRAFLHRRWWINDPDCVLVRQNDTDLSMDELRLWLSVVALSGGAVLMSDRMMDLSEERLVLLDKILPVYGKGGVAVDALRYSEPRLFCLGIDSATGTYAVLGAVNLSEEPIEIDISPTELGLKQDQVYNVFDFWEQRYRGQFTESLKITELRPHSCRLLCIRPQTDAPSVLSTSIHFTQGAVEIRAQDWDPVSSCLSVIMNVDTVTAHTLFIYHSRDFRVIDATVDSKPVKCQQVTGEVVALTSSFMSGQEIRVRFAKK